MKISALSTIGIILTIIYGLFLFYLVQPKLSCLGSMSLNNIGDFLAGAFGPLAIFWLILGFLQQGKELKQSTEVLKLQAKELNDSVEQQKELVSLSKEQIDSTREEQKVNRTINEIENWLLIKRKVEEEELDRKNINSLCSKIEWIISIKEHDFQVYFDYELLMNVLVEPSTWRMLTNMYSSLDDEVQASLDDQNLKQNLIL